MLVINRKKRVSTVHEIGDRIARVKQRIVRYSDQKHVRQAERERAR